MAHFDIYVLNYNGASYLTPCLQSLLSLNLGVHTADINVVDNCSSDHSKLLVKRDFSDVNLISLKKNFGFSKGNNLAVAMRRKESRRKADFNVFLNNDTIVDSEWLKSAADAFERNQDVGIVGSKSVFYHRFVVLRLVANTTYRPSEFGHSIDRDTSFLLKKEFSGHNLDTIFRFSRINGSHTQNHCGNWIGQEAKIFLAVQNNDSNGNINFVIENHNPAQDQASLQVFLNDQKTPILELEVPKGAAKTVSLDFKATDYVDLIQNAGSLVYSNWNAEDRGYMEIDNQQYDQECQVAAICGVSMFIKEDLFRKLKGFDENYFAYFEDTDLSLRARLMGYKCLYVPESKLRHYHCGTAIESSDYFNSNVAFSHLVFLSKLLPYHQWREKLSGCRSAARNEFILFEKDRLLEGKSQLRALAKYFRRWPKFVFNRIFRWANSPELKLASVLS